MDAQVIERVQKELETEFIPDLYDKAMGKMFNDKYYEVEEEEEVEDDKLTLGLLQENEAEGDLEAEMTKGFK